MQCLRTPPRFSKPRPPTSRSFAPPRCWPGVHAAVVIPSSPIAAVPLLGDSSTAPVVGDQQMVRTKSHRREAIPLQILGVRGTEIDGGSDATDDSDLVSVDEVQDPAKRVRRRPCRVHSQGTTAT